MILPKASRYPKTFKVKDEYKNNKLMSFCIDDDELLEKYETIWIKIEDLKNVELNALPVYDDRYMKTKVGTYGDKIYTIFHGLNMPEDGVEWESFKIISIDPLLLYEYKYYLQVYLENCVYIIVGKKMRNYLDENIFETGVD